MVKVAFIVEGKVEQIIIDYLHSNGWFTQFNIEKIGPTIDAKGGGNLCPRNMPIYVAEAQTHNPDKIFILTDLECDPCVTKTKERLGDCDECTIVLAKKAIEAWFLADDELLLSLTNGELNHYDEPEGTTQMPYDELKAILLETTGRGTGTKASFALRVKRLGFNMDNAASHVNCPSAKYFIDKLHAVGRN